MVQVTIQGVAVSYPKDTVFNSGVGPQGPWNELDMVVTEELALFKEKGIALASVSISTDNEGMLVIEAKEKSPIRRVRRITGYLSNQENFSDAKASELLARRDHTGDHKQNYLRGV